MKVGVPPPDNPRTFKVIFTTRGENVCGLMGAHKKIKIQGLSKEEAFSLFEKKVGGDTLKCPIIRTLAQDVVEACKGLPLALIIVGRAMADKEDPRDWDRAVAKLRRDPSRITGMEEDVYPILKFSYDSLRDDTIKSCFIYCCIYPEDHDILVDDLLDLWIGEGFLDEFSNTHEARDQGREIVRRLKAACLLENCESEHRVRMHDVIRRMALWISSGSIANKKKYLVLDHDAMFLAPEVESAERISLWGISNKSNICDIPPCPNVVTIIARFSHNIPWGFLQFMDNVKVLDLSDSLLEELPSGINKLVELQFLNLTNTNIKELPMEIKNLAKMRCLILEVMPGLAMIPRGVISSFSELRVLRISDYCEHVSPQENNLGGGGRHLLEELELLPHINDISIILSLDGSFIHKLQCSYKIQNCLRRLGCFGLTSLELSSSSVKTMRHLEKLGLYNCVLERLIIVRDPTTMDYGCFRNLCHVWIVRCQNLQDLTWLIYAPMLEHLLVHRCNSLTEIVKEDLPSDAARAQADRDVFTRLKHLQLFDLPTLQSVYPRPLPFPSLVIVDVSICKSLRRLPFDSGSAKHTLKMIVGEREWWDMLQWDNVSLEPLFRPYFESDM